MADCVVDVVPNSRGPVFGKVLLLDEVSSVADPKIGFVMAGLWKTGDPPKKDDGATVWEGVSNRGVTVDVTVVVFNENENPD